MTGLRFRIEDEEQHRRMLRIGEGYWGGPTGRQWIPNNPGPQILYPSNNPNFDSNCEPTWYMGNHK